MNKLLITTGNFRRLIYSIIFLLLIFSGCVTPSRLGVSYKGQQVISSSGKPMDNPNIDLSVNSLTKEDNGYDVKKLKNKFITYVYKNEMLTNLLQKYPETRIEMEITPSEKIKRTWILDAIFFYPGCGYLLPYTPWWGTVNLDAKLTISIPNNASSDFKFSTFEPFKINIYPYYRAGGILTQTYSVTYNNLFEEISKYSFNELADIVNSGTGTSFSSKYVFNHKSDVDNQIPESAAKNQYRFALIIGNEDYSSQQSELKSEVNVDFARNDASAFKEYAIKGLGIPEDNITLVLDGTTGKMKQAVEKISLLTKNSFGSAEIFFYYAGHGLPDEINKEPYLIPVDVSGSNVADGIKLSDVYEKLTKYPSKGVTVFLDACFSGGARGQGLIAARGVKIKAKENILDGNIVVFSASSGEQSSLSYKEKEHGLFTYFLLKKLKDSQVKVTYKDLSDYLNQQVGLNSVLINNKEQNPQTNVSSKIESQWQNWKFQPEEK